MAGTLSKSERLSGTTGVSALMNGGRWGHVTHFRFLVRHRDDGSELNRIMVSVPKKNFKRAVKRNLLKRRIREAYRTQKDLAAVRGVDILFYYSSAEIVDSTVIRAEVASILAGLK